MTITYWLAAIPRNDLLLQGHSSARLPHRFVLTIAYASMSSSRRLTEQVLEMQVRFDMHIVRGYLALTTDDLRI